MAISAIILAAGEGTRMKSDLPKVLHAIRNRPMVAYVVDAVKAVDPDRVVMVIGYGADRVRAACANDGVEFVVQEERLGTGHAVILCEPAFADYDGTVLVLNGDVPLLRPQTIEGFVRHHRDEGAAATVLTAKMGDPTGYGRIVRAADGSLLAIVEHKDASDEEREIDEINSGLFCFEASALFGALKQTNRNNAQREYYLTDVISVLREKGQRVGAYCVSNNQEVAGVNTVEELDSVRRYYEKSA